MTDPVGTSPDVFGPRYPLALGDDCKATRLLIVWHRLGGFKIPPLALPADEVAGHQGRPARAGCTTRAAGRSSSIARVGTGAGLAASTGAITVDSGGVKLIHCGGLKLIHPFVQWSPEA
jgi:hypothetical protein